jgi:hypothetical protein
MGNNNNNKIWIAVVDDWELRGNGSGNVVDLQFNNSVRLMESFKKLGIRSTFNIEVMQQLAFENYAGNYGTIRDQRDSWINAVKIMQENGFDIQLHIHPQWHGASFNGKLWKMGTKWNIIDYPDDLIDKFVDDSLKYLSSQFNVHPVSFCGGAGGVCPPTRPLFEILEKKGIRVDISIVNGLYSNTGHIKLDYTSIESPYLPYFPDYDDVRNVSSIKTKIIEIPTQSVLRDFKYLSGKALKKILSGKKTGHKENITENNGKSVNSDSLRGDHITGNRSDNMSSSERINKKCIIMDLTSLDIYALQLGFDIMIRRALNTPGKGMVPLVVESHTKDLSIRKLTDIENTIEYVLKKYEKYIRFVTMKEIVESIDIIQPVMIRKGKI